MSPRPKKITAHGPLDQAILATAWAQIAEAGAPALSLRAIARVLGISAPAIYNYYPDRDALVTALIVDAFTAFGATQEQAVQGIPQEDYAQRLRALGNAYRAWAVAHPQRYQLIFGTPIAGYAAPAEITVPAAARSLAALIGVLHAAQLAGQLGTQQTGQIPPEVLAMLQAWQRQTSPDISPEVLLTALLTWSRVHGLVALEVGGQLPVFITDPGAVYRLALEQIVRETLSPNAKG